MPVDYTGIAAQAVSQLGETPFRLIVLLIVYLGVKELRKMRGSMDRLHDSLSKMLDKVNGHEKRIRKLEKQK